MITQGLVTSNSPERGPCERSTKTTAVNECVLMNAGCGESGFGGKRRRRMGNCARMRHQRRKAPNFVVLWKSAANVCRLSPVLKQRRAQWFVIQLSQQQKKSSQEQNNSNERRAAKNKTTATKEEQPRTTTTTKGAVAAVGTRDCWDGKATLVQSSSNGASRSLGRLSPTSAAAAAQQQPKCSA